MRKITLFAFLLIVVFVMQSCRKNVIKVDDNYVGYWIENHHGGDYCNMVLDISESGRAHYFASNNLTDCNKKGIKGVARVNKRSMRIGFTVIEIIEEPTVIDVTLVETHDSFVQSTTKMVLKDNRCGAARTFYRL